uniref:(California timema) hypothetical protein n=1 Tax=Timema californicum TaxID=61474 RepID=A0A7R9J784_TIMCA|nr:unnamed protein product [Timema californicum]
MKTKGKMAERRREERTGPRWRGRAGWREGGGGELVGGKVEGESWLEGRRNNTDETTVLNYFDELEIHPMRFSPSDEKSPLLEDTTQTIIDQIGRPRNYGPTTEEIDEIMLKEEERKKQKKQEVESKEEEMKKRAREERMIKMEEWGTLMNTLKEEEEELLAVQGTPLRHYLMRYIFPVLTKGLMEVAKVRPSDPVDYLAEFLFRENPEGKMFQPDIVEAAQDLLEVIYKFQDTLMIQQELDQNILDKPQELDQNILDDKPQELDQNILDKPQELDQNILDKPQELDQNILDDKPQELDQNILDDKPQQNETN